jgi:hypothetical protein
MKKGQLSTEKIDKASRVVSMKIECGNCKWRFTEDTEKLSIMGYDHECELCGSHGSVEVNVTCPKCHKDLTVEIRSW